MESIVSLKLLIPRLPRISLVINPTEFFQASDPKALKKKKNTQKNPHDSCPVSWNASFLGFHNTFLFCILPITVQNGCQATVSTPCLLGRPCCWSFPESLALFQCFIMLRGEPHSVPWPLLLHPELAQISIWNVKFYSIPYSPHCHPTILNLSSFSFSFFLHCHINIPFTQATQTTNLGIILNYFSPFLPAVHHTTTR